MPPFLDRRSRPHGPRVAVVAIHKFKSVGGICVDRSKMTRSRFESGLWGSTNSARPITVVRVFSQHSTPSNRTPRTTQAPQRRDAHARRRGRLRICLTEQRAHQHQQIIKTTRWVRSRDFPPFHPLPSLGSGCGRLNMSVEGLTPPSIDRLDRAVPFGDSGHCGSVDRSIFLKRPA